jgi:hypothetical protein
MANIQKHIIKIEFKPNISFNQRERMLNEDIQRNIDLLNGRGFITLSHKVNNKNEKFASVEFCSHAQPHETIKNPFIF